jgi:peroxiredoxin
LSGFKAFLDYYVNGSKTMSGKIKKTIKGVIGFAILMIVFAASVPNEGLKVGDKAPIFKVKSHDGKMIDLEASLKKGPVVLFFYRGSWCPYCNKQMAELQDSISFITGKGATIIGITPETNESMNKIVEKSHASFPLAHDEGYKIMDEYKVSYRVDKETIDKQHQYGVKLEVSNGNEDYILPVPATYVIGKDGIIKFVYFNIDYKHRASVKEIVNHI